MDPMTNIKCSCKLPVGSLGMTGFTTMRALSPLQGLRPRLAQVVRPPEQTPGELLEGYGEINLDMAIL